MFKRCLVLIVICLISAGAWAQTAAATDHTSLAVLQKRAVAGDAAAEVAWGRRVVENNPSAEDERTAAKWYRKAAVQGNTDGEWMLGSAYLAGAGVSRNAPEGLKWMRKSLDDGNLDHMINYGLASALFGTDNDAEKWVRKAAQAGSVQGMVLMGIAHVSGMMGVTKSKVAAKQWLVKAARTGDAYGQAWLGLAYISRFFAHPDVDKGLHWLRESAQQGDAVAQGILGYLRITGDKNVPKNVSQGIKWGQKAAAHENKLGYYALGLVYQNGNGVAKDPAKAWYDFAVAQRLDTKQDLTHVGRHLSDSASLLSSAQLDRLQHRVSQIEVPKKPDYWSVLQVSITPKR